MSKTHENDVEKSSGDFVLIFWCIVSVITLSLPYVDIIVCVLKVPLNVNQQISIGRTIYSLFRRRLFTKKWNYTIHSWTTSMPNELSAEKKQLYSLLYSLKCDIYCHNENSAFWKSRQHLREVICQNTCISSTVWTINMSTKSSFAPSIQLLNG